MTYKNTTHFLKLFRIPRIIITWVISWVICAVSLKDITSIYINLNGVQMYSSSILLNMIEASYSILIVESKCSIYQRSYIKIQITS